MRHLSSSEEGKDPLATAVLVAAAVAIAGFLLSMLSLLQIHGPTPYEGGSKQD
jgi:hypothetical protein